MWKKSNLFQKMKRVVGKDHFMINDTIALVTQVTYREARLDEIKSLQSLQKRVYPDRLVWSRHAFLAELNGNKPVKYLVAICRDELVGFGGIRVEETNAHISNLAVLPDYQGNGIGSELLAKLLDFSESYDVTTVSLEVRASNEKAQRLYKGLGFEIMRTKQGYYQDGEDAYLMVLDNKRKENVNG